jgi:hypothetical protein
MSLLSYVVQIGILRACELVFRSPPALSAGHVAQLFVAAAGMVIVVEAVQWARARSTCVAAAYGIVFA